MIGTLCALIYVFYTENCEYYKKLHAIYMMLKEGPVKADKHKLTPLKCRQITWAVIEDSRNFFLRHVTLRELANPRRIRWTSPMLETLLVDVRYMKNMERPNFPAAWEEKAYQQRREKGGGYMYLTPPPLPDPQFPPQGLAPPPAQWGQAPGQEQH